MTTERRRALLVAGPIALALLATACSGGGTDAADSTNVPTVAVATDPATAASSVPMPEPADALAAAIGSLGTRYAFRSDITTPAGDEVVVAGTRVDDSMMFGIEAGGTKVDVIVVAGAVWIRQNGSDEWLTSSEAPPTDPLLPLAAPLDITWDPVDPTRLVATYAAASLGVEGTESVVVGIVPAGETLTFESSAGPAQLVTTLHPVPDASPIEPPIG
jgi:hypothetical protein